MCVPKNHPSGPSPTNQYGMLVPKFVVDCIIMHIICYTGDSDMDGGVADLDEIDADDMPGMYIYIILV